MYHSTKCISIIKLKINKQIIMKQVIILLYRRGYENKRTKNNLYYFFKKEFDFYVRFEIIISSIKNKYKFI